MNIDKTRLGGTRRGRGALVFFLLLLGLGASTVLAVGVSAAKATVVVGAAPAWPIPAGAPAGPPPIPALPAAGDAAPPADQIADPVAPAASCSGWYRQSTYGDGWAAGSSWWEYRCTREDTFYSNPCTSGACDAFCWYCYWETQDWADYFYWDGASAVFYGEAYSDSVVWEGDIFPNSSSEDWWDAPTAQWYLIDAQLLSVSKEETGSGVVSSSPAGISCGGDCQELVNTGISVSLTASADPSSVFTGWSGDCSGTGACQVTMDQARSVTATFALNIPNAPPHASFTVSCTGLSCSFDGNGSSDSDGTIASYSWAFGDGATSGGANPTHTYGHTGTYSAALTVTDDRGASTTVSQNVAATNLAPTAAFVVSCSSLHCTLDASASADPDGIIATYRWNFGDTTAATVSTASTTHDYPKAGAYTVILTVTDNAGASASTSRRINPISLSARGYRQSGQQKVSLSWNGAAATSYDVYRNGAKIATVSTGAYTDSVGKWTGSYTYKVCDPASSTCSNQATVSF
jgi:PKD repeat protein